MRRSIIAVLFSGLIATAGLSAPSGAHAATSGYDIDSVKFTGDLAGCSAVWKNPNHGVAEFECVGSVLWKEFRGSIEYPTGRGSAWIENRNVDSPLWVESSAGVSDSLFGGDGYWYDPPVNSDSWSIQVGAAPGQVKITIYISCD